MTFIGINEIAQNDKPPMLMRSGALQGRKSASLEELRLWQALEEVEDPEYPISVVDMGLIYKIKLANGTASVDLTFTSMGCPCMEFIISDIRERLFKEPSVNDVMLQIVWDPPWTSKQLTAKGRKQLKQWGVAA